MRIPRDVSADVLVSALRKLGYSITRQRGSHIRVTTQVDGEHHETIPAHRPLKAGTLAAILKSIAQHHSREVEELLALLDL